MKIMIHLKSHIYIDTFLKTKGEYKHGKIKYFYYQWSTNEWKGHICTSAIERIS